jgi:hypothetical protein
MSTDAPLPFFQVTFARAIPLADRTLVPNDIYVDFMHRVRDAARHQVPIWMDITGVEIVGVAPNEQYAGRADNDDHELRVTTHASVGTVAAYRIPVVFEFEYWNNPNSTGAILSDHYALVADTRFPVDSAQAFEAARVAANVHRQGGVFSAPSAASARRTAMWFR